MRPDRVREGRCDHDGAGGDLLDPRARGRSARHRDGSRSPVEGGRGRDGSLDPGFRGDDHARDHRARRRDGGRGAPSHAGARHPPPPRDGRGRARRGRRFRHRSDGTRAERAVHVPAGHRSGEVDRRGRRSDVPAPRHRDPAGGDGDRPRGYRARHRERDRRHHAASDPRRDRASSGIRLVRGHGSLSGARPVTSSRS